MEKVFYSVREACELLGIRKTSLYRICKDGAITYYKGAGGNAKMRFNKCDLLAYMEQFKSNSI